MADLEGIFAKLDDLLLNSRTEEALARVEALLDDLTDEEVAELGAWLKARSVTSARLADEEQTRADDWEKVGKFAQEGESLEQVWPRLPTRLQLFIRREAERGTLFRTIDDVPGMPKGGTADGQ